MEVPKLKNYQVKRKNNFLIKILRKTHGCGIFT